MQFCRDIVENNLPSIIYFHNHFVKFLNLVNKFLTSCDFKGEYAVDAPIEKDLVLTIPQDVHDTLLECRDNRNSKNWAVFCRGVCKHFKISAFSGFFEPNLKLMSQFSNFIVKQLDAIKFQEARNPLIANANDFNSLPMPTIAPTPPRLLEEAANDGEAAPEDATQPIFKEATGAKVLIHTLVTDFAENGVRLSSIGETQNVSQPTFDQIKVLDNLEKLKKQGQSLTDDQKALIGGKK